MREAFADLPAEKRAALLPVVSPLDVLLVGNDRGGNAAKAAASIPTPDLSRSAVSLDTLRALLKDEATMSRSLERVGLAAETLAASNNWVVSGKHTASGKPLLANDPHLAPSAP